MRNKDERHTPSVSTADTSLGEGGKSFYLPLRGGCHAVTGGVVPCYLQFRQLPYRAFSLYFSLCFYVKIRPLTIIKSLGGHHGSELLCQKGA
jgi:hypothetical protein